MRKAKKENIIKVKNKGYKVKVNKYTCVSCGGVTIKVTKHRKDKIKERRITTCCDCKMEGLYG